MQEELTKQEQRKKGKLKQLIEHRVWDIGSRVDCQGVLLSRFIVGITGGYYMARVLRVLTKSP